MKLIPKGAVKAVSTKQEITETKTEEILGKARELLMVEMSKEEMVSKLQHFYVYGVELTGNRAGNAKDNPAQFTVAEGHTSEHFTSAELGKIVDLLYVELNVCEKCGKYPCECKIEEPKEIPKV